MRRVHPMLVAAILAVTGALASAGHGVMPADAGVLPSPQISSPLLATLSNRDIAIDGMHLGVPSSIRELRFSSPEGMISLPSTSPLVSTWTPVSITAQLPPGARSGTVQIVVDGQQSAPVQLLVFEYSSTAIPGGAHPLDLSVDAAGKVWVSEEFQSKLTALTPAETTTIAQVPIPQHSPPGIFAVNDASGDRRTNINILGEDVDVASDGSVWFTQGGAYHYPGQHANTSRIVRYVPATGAFRCYVVPDDNAEITSVVLDAPRGKAWYVLAALSDDGNAIGGFDLTEVESDCAFNPLASSRPPLCAQAQVPGCHERFALPTASTGPMHLAISPSGDVWYTGYWSNRLGVLDPDTGGFKELPLPPSRIQQGTGVYVGAAPARLAFDGAGNLWVSEEFDATIDRVRPSLMATLDCEQLDASNNNPCIDEVFVGSNGADGYNIANLAIGNDGYVWFTYNGQSHTLLAEDVINPSAPRPQIGFIATGHGDAVVLLPPLEQTSYGSGIVQDAASGAVWFGEFFERRVGRLIPAQADGDGIALPLDNCPDSYNPMQTNSDRNFVDLSPPFAITVEDRTHPNSDSAGDACDLDDDNDGISDADEGSGSACSGVITDPLLRDTDGDRALDGAECEIGTDAASAASTPMLAQCGAADDADGDKIVARIEYCYYNSNADSVDTDGDRALDGAKDGCEIASLNGDRAVSSGDQGMLAASISRIVAYHPNVDLNKDGLLNSGDQGLMASFISPPGQCP